jgi:hypothetical protein
MDQKVQIKDMTDLQLAQALHQKHNEGHVINNVIASLTSEVERRDNEQRIQDSVSEHVSNSDSSSVEG